MSTSIDISSFYPSRSSKFRTSRCLIRWEVEITASYIDRLTSRKDVIFLCSTLVDGKSWREDSWGENWVVSLSYAVEGESPFLVDLCITKGINNVRYLGDVGETDLDHLGQILPHCTVGQFMHIEKSTKVSDYSLMLQNSFFLLMGLVFLIETAEVMYFFSVFL